MNGSWVRGMVVGALVAAVGAPHTEARDTAAEARDRRHEQQSKAKIAGREAKPGPEKAKDRADDAADATKAAGARAARSARKAGRSVKAGTHHAAGKISDQTKD